MSLRPPDWTSEDGSVQLYCADCMDILREMEPGSVDAVVTDPPYGVNFTGKVTKHKDLRGQECYFDTEQNLTNNIIPRVDISTRKAKRSAIFCGFNNIQKYRKCDGIGGIVCPNGTGITSWGFACFNPILFYGVSPYMSAGLGGRPTVAVLNIPNGIINGNNGIDHPCPKPIAFMDWTVKTASLPGDVVFDPFMGSGTTGVACVRLGRRFIGIEIEPKYFEIARKRIQKAFDDQALFKDLEPEPKQQEMFEEAAG